MEVKRRYIFLCRLPDSSDITDPCFEDGPCVFPIHSVLKCSIIFRPKKLGSPAQIFYAVQYCIGKWRWFKPIFPCLIQHSPAVCHERLSTKTEGKWYHKILFPFPRNQAQKKITCWSCLWIAAHNIFIIYWVVPKGWFLDGGWESLLLPFHPTSG